MTVSRPADLAKTKHFLSQAPDCVNGWEWMDEWRNVVPGTWFRLCEVSLEGSVELLLSGQQVVNKILPPVSLWLHTDERHVKVEHKDGDYSKKKKNILHKHEWVKDFTLN